MQARMEELQARLEAIEARMEYLHERQRELGRLHNEQRAAIRRGMRRQVAMLYGNGDDLLLRLQALERRARRLEDSRRR